MTLTNRLSWFFLWALGLVLVGYCATLYLLARSYLYNQVDERLDAALTILAAAIENEADGLKWDKEEHRLPLGKDSDPDQVRWMVYDEAGVAVDSSANLEGGDLLARADDARGGTPWRLTQKRVDATRFLPERAPADGERRYRFLLVTAGVSLEPVQTTLRNLALVLTGLSAGLWMVFVFAGRSLCRRGLGHLTQMAATARTMSAANLNQRLPNPQTKDELEDLAAGFNELLTRVFLPEATADYQGVYRKLRIRGSIDYPLAGIAVVLKRSNGHCADARVALTAVNPAPVLVKGAAEALAGKVVDASLAERIGNLAAKTAKPLTTSALTPEYRREMIRVFTRRAVLAAAQS